MLDTNETIFDNMIDIEKYKIGEYVDYISKIYDIDERPYQTKITEKGKEFLGGLVRHYFNKEASFQFLGSKVKNLGDGLEIARSTAHGVDFGIIIDPNDFETYFVSYIETQTVHIRYIEIDDTIYVVQYRVAKFKDPTGEIKIPINDFHKMMEPHRNKN